MIRFLLLLLILHGAELLSNHTDDTEYFVTAAPETLGGEVRTSRIPIQNLTSGQMDKITATPPSPPPSMEEKIQKSSFLIDSLTTPDDFQSLRGEWKKNSTSQTQPGSPGLSPNVAHAYPTKMPIILSTEHVREPSPRTSKHRKIPSPPIKTKNVKKTTGEGPGVIEGRNPEELQEEHVPKEDKGSNVSFPSTNFATDVHSDEDGEMSASKVAKTSHVDHLSGIRSRRLKPLVPGMELASEVLRAPFTNLLPNSSAQSLRTLLKEDASSISSRLHPGAGIMSNSTSEKIIQEQEAILRKGNSLLESEHPISRKNPLSNFAERVHDIFGVSHSRTHAEDISTTSQKTRYNNISKTLLFGDVDVPETGGNRLTLTEDGLKMVTANPDLLHHEQSQLKTEAQSKLTPSEQPLATIQTKLLEGLQNNTQTSRPRNGSHGQTHRETPTYEQADQVPEPKTQTEGGLFPEKGVNSASNSTERGWTQANNSTELKMAAQIQTLLPNVTHPQTPTTQHLTRAAEHGAKTPSKGNVTIVMQQSRTHSIQDISAMMPADQIVELANTQAEPVPENQTVPGTYTKSNPVGKTTPTAATEKVGDLNQGEQFTKLFRSALEMETSTVLITTTQTNPGLTSEDQLDVTGHMRRLISTTIHLGLTPGSQQGAPTIPPGLTETHRSRSRSQNSPAQTENFRRDFRTEIPSQTTTRHGSPIHAMQGTRTQLRPSTNYHSTYDLAVSNLTNGSTYTMTDMPLRPITSALYAKTQDELFTVSQSQEDTQAKSSQATWTIVDPTANITQSDKPTSKKANLGISNVSKNTTEKQPMFMPPIQWGMDTQTQPGQMARTRPDLHAQTQPNLTVNTHLDLMTQPITVPTDLADHNQTQHGDTTVESTSLTNHDFITEGKIELVKAPEHELSTNFTPKQATQNHLNIVSKSEPNLTTQTQPDVSTQSQPDLVTHDQVTKTPDLIHISNGSADISNSTEPHTSAKLGFETQTWLPRSTQTDSTTQTKPELNEETQSQPPNTHQYPDTNPDTELEQVQTTQSHVSPKSHSVTTWIWPIMKMETTETEGVQHQQSQSIENATTVFTQTETDISLVTDDGSDRHVSSSAPPVTAEHVQEPDVSGREWHVVSNRPSQPVTQGSGKSPSWTLGTTSNPKPRAPGTEEHYAVPTTREGLTVRKPEQRLSSASPTTIKSLLSPRLSSNTYAPQTTSEVVSVHPGRERIFIVDEQLPVFKVQTINVTYRMNLEGAAPGPCGRPETCQTLLRQEVASFYQSVPGFDGVELSNFTWDGRLLGYRVHLSVRVGSSMSETQELVLSDPRWLFESSQDPEDSLSSEVHSISLTEKHADPCTDWFSCPDGFQCIPVRKLGARCQSPCHDLFCHNHGICIHRKGQEPECQCPIGRDFWYMGQTCDYRMTHHRLAAIACAVVFCIIICAAAAVFVLVRRFQTQILRQKVAQTQSSYRRFSRFDDVPTHFWCPSQTWLTASASLNSLDNPAFSSSEEVFPLQALGSCVCGCQDGAPSCAQSIPPPPPTRVLPRLQTSCSSVNDIMIDSGKASDVSVSSWPMEPIHWTPFPILHQLSLQSPFHARRPHSYFEGMELVNTERSWTA